MLPILSSSGRGDFSTPPTPNFTVWHIGDMEVSRCDIITKANFHAPDLCLPGPPSGDCPLPLSGSHTRRGCTRRSGEAGRKCPSRGCTSDDGGTKCNGWGSGGVERRDERGLCDHFLVFILFHVFTNTQHKG